MRIEQSSIGMAAGHQLVSHQERLEKAQTWVTAPPAPPPETPPIAQGLAVQDEKAPSELRPTPQDELKMLIVAALIESVTGKRIDMQPVETPSQDDSTQRRVAEIQQLADKKGNIEAQGAAQRPRVGWGMEVDIHERYQESEATTFAAKGTIKTQDGKEIAFEVQVSMSRSFVVENDLHFQAGDPPLRDPLVINFGGQATELSTTKFRFDLDADGEQDQISYLKGDSGFLALDKNSDGVVNNGAELVGAISGNGFSELARFDEDGNGWIDERDSIFNQLRVWSFDDQGKPQLVALGEKGVGAIYVGHVNTPFELKQGANPMDGKVRETGLYVSEEGQPGTIQQIDLAV